MSLSTEHAVVTSSSIRPMKKTTGSHSFTIMGYSLDKDTDKGNFVESAIFNVGGYDWCIRYCPNGSVAASDDDAAIFLCPKSKRRDVKVQFSFTLLNRSENEMIASSRTEDFKTECVLGWGYRFKRSYLTSKMKDNCFVIMCVITIYQVLPVEPTPQIVVPPGTFQLQLGHLLETGTGADVTFDVKGVTFSAHKCILAARSPVFSAQFFGPMKEKSDTIKMEEMEAPVFKSLLHFIYHDAFLGLEELKENEEEQDSQYLMTQHLLVAADRYDLERLKIMCEKILAEATDKSNVVDLLALADRHSCNHLKKSCLKILVSTEYC